MVHNSRWNFLKTVPNPEESTNDYVNRLVNIAVDCDFENFSIKGAIMQNLLAYSIPPCLRQVVLDEELSIDQTLIWAKKLEEKCAEELASLKTILNNQHSNDNCDVEFISQKIEINADQIDDFSDFDPQDDYVNETNIDEDTNEDYLDSEMNYNNTDNDLPDKGLDKDYIQKPSKVTKKSNPDKRNTNSNKKTDSYPQVACEECGKKVRVSRLNIHMRKFHNKLGPVIYKCESENCDKQFTSIWSLKQHTKKHNGITAPKAEPPDFKLYDSKRRETTNPGILIIHGYKFCFKRSLKTDGPPRYHYVCTERESNYECRCSATITTEFDPTGQDIPKHILTRWPSIGDHSHEPVLGDVILEEMIREMEERVTKDPTRLLSSIRKEVMAEYEDKYTSTKPNIWDAFKSKMAKYKSQDFIDQRLRRVRQKVIGNVQKNEFDPVVQNLAEKIIKDMKQKVEADPTVQLLKVHDDVFRFYESEFGHKDIWANVILALGKVGSRLQRLRKVRTKLLGDVPSSMFMYSKSREKKE